MKIIYDLREIEEKLYNAIDPYEVPAVMQILDELPDAEGGDLISRQAAIEKAEMLFKTLSKETVDMMGIGFNHAVADAIAILKNLPSADPQIVSCRDCQNWDGDGHWCGYFDSFTRSEDFCSKSVRCSCED